MAINDIGLSFTDSRDDARYKVIRVGTRLWTTENCRFYCSAGSFGYGNCNSNIRSMGCLYAREVLDAVCPDGWRLPTVKEWAEMYSAVYGKFRNLSLVEFMAGTAAEMGVLPMSGIGKMTGDSLYDEANFADMQKAAYFWTGSFDKAGDRKIFRISQEGTKEISSKGRELCSIRLVCLFNKEDPMS